MLLIQEFKDFINEINIEHVDWKNKKQTKYSIYYDYYRDDNLYQDSWSSLKNSIFYSTNKKFLDLAMERFGVKKLKMIYGDEE